jgi:hypothetical protein
VETRTCPECNHVQPVPTDATERWNLRKCECGERWCPECQRALARVRFVPLGCQGTKYHVSVCRPCRDKLAASDKL